MSPARIGMSRATIRGAAMVEAVCIVPVLGLLLLGVMHLHRVHATDRDLAQRTRHCALLHARSGCDEASLPPQCQGAFGGAGAADEDARQALSDEAADTAQRSGAQTSLFDRAGELPVLGAAIEALFGRGQLARLSAETPAMASERPLRLHARHHVLCDVKPSDGDDVAAQLFDALVPF